jgi:FtsP/CotA-like multicopper oxidase with cupredoxin domain
MPSAHRHRRHCRAQQAVDRFFGKRAGVPRVPVGCYNSTNARLKGQLSAVLRDQLMQTAGIIKDVVMVGGYQEVEFDFVADNPGLTLFHCYQQLRMDFGFMALFNYA